MQIFNAYDKEISKREGDGGDGAVGQGGREGWPGVSSRDGGNKLGEWPGGDTANLRA